MQKTKQRFGKFLLIAFSLLFALSGGIISNAAVDNEFNIAPCNINIDHTGAALSISRIKAECSASLYAKKSAKLKIKMELQKEKSGGYETVETWSDSKTGTILSMSKSRNVNMLCNYRLKVTFTAGSETETIYKYS
jgi:hypothetical protein